ncbi:MAG: hypothetical protein SGPRY_002176 [Prymnesium sp.]
MERWDPLGVGETPPPRERRRDELELLVAAVSSFLASFHPLLPPPSDVPSLAACLAERVAEWEEEAEAREREAEGLRATLASLQRERRAFLSPRQPSPPPQAEVQEGQEEAGKTAEASVGGGGGGQEEREVVAVEGEREGGGREGFEEAVAAAREEGRAEGAAMGREEGWEAGAAAGREQGRAEGELALREAEARHERRMLQLRSSQEPRLSLAQLTACRPSLFPLSSLALSLALALAFLPPPALPPSLSSSLPFSLPPSLPLSLHSVLLSPLSFPPSPSLALTVYIIPSPFSVPLVLLSSLTLLCLPRPPARAFAAERGAREK